VGDPGRERRAPSHLALETTEPTSFGYGFVSGLLSALLGMAGFGIVLSLRFPQYFGYGELRPLQSVEYLRAGIHLTLVAAFLLGTVSAFLRANKTLALTGIGFTLAAALIGGSQVDIGNDAGVSSLASRRRTGSGRQELRGPHADLRHPVWYLLPAEPLADVVRTGAPAGRAGAVGQSIALPVSATGVAAGCVARRH
jgi:hypothetical protein